MPRFLTILVNLVEPNGTFSSSLVSFLRPVVSQLSSLHLQVCSLFEVKLNFFLNSLTMTLAGLTPNYRCRVPGCESANASYYDNQVNHHIEWCQFHQEWRWFGQVVTDKEVRSFTPCFTKTPLKDFSLKGPKQLTWLVQGTAGLRAPLSGSKGEFLNCWFCSISFLVLRKLCQGVNVEGRRWLWSQFCRICRQVFQYSVLEASSWVLQKSTIHHNIDKGAKAEVL